MDLQANVHPSEAGLAAAVMPGDEAVDAKDRLVIGFWRDAIDAEFTVQGLEYTADPEVDVLADRFERIKLDVVLTRRRHLENNPLFRHPIPYALLHRHNIEKNCLEFFIYQRTKLVGESKLAGNHSIGLGGHPEAPSMRFYPNWTLNVRDALLASLVDELEEEVEFSGMSFKELIQSRETTFSHEGFIRDDANEVGKQHLGIVYSIGIPSDIEVTCKEAELITVGFRSLDEITSADSGFNLERWSYILADAYKRQIEAATAQAALDAQANDEALRYREEAERLAQLPPVDMTEADALQYLNTSGFNLLEWKLEEGEKLVTREGRPFLDAVINHPMEGRKVVVIALDPADSDPVSTVTQIKAALLEGWDTLKGNPVPAELGLMDGDLPEEPLETGEDGCELEQEDDGDIPDSGEDPEEPFVYPEGFGPVSFKSAAFADKAGIDLNAIALPEDARFASKDGDLGVYMVTTVDHPEKGVLYVTTNLLVGDTNPLLTLEAVKKHALGDSSAVEALTASGHWKVSEELIHKAWGIGEEEVVNIGRGTVMETVHRPDLDALETRPAYPRGGRPEIAHIDEATFLHRPNVSDADMRDAHDSAVGSDSSGSDSSSPASE